MFLLALVLLAGADGRVPETMDAAAVPNYRRVRPDLATAGQPTADTLRKLKDLGFKTVVNLRTEGENGAVADEKAIVEAAGLRYVHVPITAATFSRADVDAVGRVLDDPAAGPVLLHCAAASRVGAVWTVHQVGKGKSYEAAEAEGKTIGLKTGPMSEAVKRVLETPPQR
jgi:uncharacterized protein (TIGR01244 family)